MRQKIVTIALLGMLGAGSTAAFPFSETRAAQLISQTSTAPDSLQSTIKLLNPGVAARQLLRYKPAVNSKQAIVMNMKTSSTIALVGMNRQSASNMQAKAESTITKVDTNGDIHYSFQYVDWNLLSMDNLPETSLEAIRSQFKKLAGVQVNGVMNERGQMKMLKLANSAAIDPTTSAVLDQMMQSMRESSSIPLPEEAVGVGAKWQVTQPIETMGLSIVQTSVYELVSLQDGVMTLKRSVLGQAKPGAANVLGVATAQVKVKSINATGQDQIVLRRDRIIPQKQQSTITTKVEMDINLPNTESTAPATSRAETKLEINLESQ
jgi:hypothetical protein